MANPRTENIDQIIKKSDLSSKYNIKSGDCSSVAKAIFEVFGGSIMTISSVPEERFFDHLAVKIDGVLYDGRGRVSWSQIEDEFVPEQSWSGAEKHWFKVNNIREDSMYEEKIAQDIIRILKKNM